jgi:hypothetical protein
MDPEAENRLLARAATQFGVFTIDQARRAGVSRSTVRTRVEKGIWQRVHRRVYFVGGHWLTQGATHLASVLAGPPGTRSSHRAAAWIWSLTAHPQRAEITTTSSRSRISGVRCHFTETALGEPDVRRGIAVTSPAETLLDLGGVLTVTKVREALDRGIANRVLTPMDALAELRRRGGTGVRGTAALRALLDATGVSGSHHPSVLEAKTRRLIQRAGLPQPECELIAGVNGEYRLDFTWPELQLVVEVDGWMYHSSFEAFHSDKTRKNALTIEGLAFLNYTWMHITRTPNDVIRELRTAYAARSRSLVGA